MNEGEINTIKLTSGEEVVAKIIKIADGMLVIKQPVSIAPGPQSPQLVPSMFTAELDQEVIMYATAIAMIAPTRGEVKASYIKATSGIDVPPEKKILVG
jgi:hypothetical protein